MSSRRDPPWPGERVCQAGAALLQRPLGRHEGSDDLLRNDSPGLRSSAETCTDGDALSGTVEGTQLDDGMSLGDVRSNDGPRRRASNDVARVRREACFLLQSRENADLPRDPDFAAATENEPDSHLPSS